MLATHHRTCGPCRSHVAAASRRQRPITNVAAPNTAPTVIKDPFAEKAEYKDSAFDRIFIKIYTHKMAQQLSNVHVPADPTYDDFVRVSKEIMKGRTPQQQKEVVNNVLKSLLPEQAPKQFRRLFPPTQMSAELNAWFASQGFGWLVGEMELQTAEVEVAAGVKRTQKSLVQIKKCRYIEASGCVAMCVNMCKVPTQEFFTNDFGLPLTMEPNFEDLSCKMIFGQAPLPLAQDPASQQPCFAAHCSIADSKPAPCPRTSV